MGVRHFKSEGEGGPRGKPKGKFRIREWNRDKVVKLLGKNTMTQNLSMRCTGTWDSTTQTSPSASIARALIRCVIVFAELNKSMATYGKNLSRKKSVKSCSIETTPTSNAEIKNSGPDTIVFHYPTSQEESIFTKTSVSNRMINSLLTTRRRV